MNKIGENSFFRSVLTVTSGTAVSQLVVILVSPLITRLYSPNDMGVLASYTAIAGILGTVIAGCYNQAVVLPETKRQTNAVVFLGILIAAIGCGILTIVSVLFDDVLIDLLNLQSIKRIWFYLLGVFVFFIGVDSVLNQYAIKNAHFKLIATTQVTQQVITNASKISLGFCGFTTIGLFVSTFLGQISRVVQLSFSASKGIAVDKKDIPTGCDLKNAMTRYKKYPLVSSWSALLNAASVQLPVILFTSLFSPAVAGAYSLSHRILNLPIALIGNSIGQVFLEDIAKKKLKNEKIDEITLTVFSKLILIGSASFSFIFFYGEYIFYYIFGEEWLEAGLYSKYVSIWILFQLSISPLSSILIVLEKQMESLFWNLLLFLSRISFLPFVYFSNLLVSEIVLIYSLISAVFYFCFALRIMFLARVQFTRVFFTLTMNCLLIYFVQFLLYKVVIG